MASNSDFKVKEVGGGSAFDKYRRLMYGDRSLGYVVGAELLQLFLQGLPGALGIVLRKTFYPALFKSAGRGCVFGRNITLRHAHKISLGEGVILDDNSVVDAKGESNAGVQIGDGVYIGRNTIVYCKNGDITLGDGVNISANCQIFSSNKLTLGANTVVGAFSYFLSGGEYDYASSTPFAQQSGQETKGPLTIGANCWFGANVTVTDAANVGEHCVIGAGAVVVKPVPANSIAVGIPARVVKSLGGPPAS
jgi:acetyltransferase-like isoleucine patch superfamily enzyme